MDVRPSGMCWLMLNMLKRNNNVLPFFGDSRTFNLIPENNNHLGSPRSWFVCQCCSICFFPPRKVHKVLCAKCSLFLPLPLKFLHIFAHIKFSCGNELCNLKIFHPLEIFVMWFTYIIPFKLI